jgi:hypothetical protein
VFIRVIRWNRSRKGKKIRRTGKKCRPPAGNFISGRQIAGKRAKTGMSPKNLARVRDISRLKVVQIGNKSYFCSLKDRNFKEIRC